MLELEQIQLNSCLRGVEPDALVAVVSMQWFGSEALELTYKTPVCHRAIRPLPSAEG